MKFCSYTVGGVKWPERETGNSSSSSVEINNAWSFTSTLPYAFRAWCFVFSGVVLS